MPHPARLIWANNPDSPSGITLAGTGCSEPIDLTGTATVFFSVVIGDPPQEMRRGDARLTVRLEVSDAGGTWLPVAFLRPSSTGRPPYVTPPFAHVSVGLFGCTVPVVLPPTARVRWDALLYDTTDRGVPIPFGQTVISLYGR
ncbi:hypothetical protein [Streptomyces sp. NPDC007172]|uniref:hypothetical protein n=1 Tax=Streptomyces sp. NPDC007172 TaxID=3364776 RepID=UPI0036C8FF75